MPKPPLPMLVHPPDCPYSTVCSSRFPSWFCSRPTTAEMSDSVCDTAGVPVLQPYLQQQQRCVRRATEGGKVESKPAAVVDFS